MATTPRIVRPVWVFCLAMATAAVVLFSVGRTPATSVGSGPVPDAEIVVRAKGSTGQEVMELRVDGASIARFEVSAQWQQYSAQAPSAASAPNVEVAFMNDSIDAGDRNLRVDWVSFAGQTYESESETVYGTGVWENGAECKPGYHRSELLACNGYLGFGDLVGVDPDVLASAPVAASIVSGDGSMVTVQAAGLVGKEIIEIQIDGNPVTTFVLGASSNLFSAPQWQEFVYQADEKIRADRLRIAFVNDHHQNGVDHNARIGSVRIDGVELERAAGAPFTPSGGQPTSQCVASVHADEILACNGYLSFIAPPTATDSTPTPTSTTVQTTTSTSTPVATKPVVDKPVGELEANAESPPTSTASAPATVLTETIPPARPAPPAPPSEGPATATGQFYVVGNDIVDPNGNIFYPIGANVAIKFTPYGYVFEGNNGGVNEHLADVQAWNWNTIRATLICDNDSGTPTFNELVEGIHPTIERFTEAGIVVMLECHDLTGKDPRVGSSKDRKIQKFWDEMARRYADNPYVWFNIYNEPYASADTANWTILHQHYVDRIRATGAENIIVADLPIWGQGIQLLADQDFADGLNRKCNTVFGWHAYGAVAGQQGSFADHEHYIEKVQAKDMAVVIGEYGVAWPANYGNAGPWAWNVSGFEAMNVLGPKYGIGLLWWHATGDQAYFSLYSLKEDRSGFWTSGNSGNLTPAGSDFWAVSHRVGQTRGAFAGDVADSGCPSAR